MNNVKDTDFSDAVCKVKGYRFRMLHLLGILGIFFSALVAGIIYGKKSFISSQALTITLVICSIVMAASLCLIVYDRVASVNMKNKDCVILFEDGITVFVDKPKSAKGYRHFTFDQLQDYGFIHILQSSSAGETRLLFRTKSQSSDTYLEYQLLNYGYLRLTTNDGGYYNVPVGDIKTVKDFFKQHTQIDEFVYIRIAGINDDVMINLE